MIEIGIKVHRTLRPIYAFVQNVRNRATKRDNRILQHRTPSNNIIKGCLKDKRVSP